MRRGLLVLPLTLAVLLAATAKERGSHKRTAGSHRASFDFRYDVLPLLHRQGCGSAYCHGSATGRGGFKLSLFASDPRADHIAITRDLGGRRVDLKTPANSLLLKKPSMQTRHGGGRRIHKGDDVHRALSEWISEGAPFRRGPRRELVSLELFRESHRVKPFGDRDQLVVLATFRDADGETDVDVTDLASFHSSDDRVVTVDANGHIMQGQPGEAWLFARYVNQSARLPAIQPFGAVSERDDADSTQAVHALDKLWLTRLHALGLVPGKPADPATLVRRLYLDLVDRLPNAMELAAFRKLSENERVEKTAEQLVASRDFAVKFGRHLAEWLEIPLEPPARRNPRTGLFEAQHRRLVEEVAAGHSVYAIVEAKILRDRSLLYRFPDPRDRAELAGRAFLGIRIGCARCHDSPVDRWERKNHLSFSALFTDPRPDPKGGTKPGILFDPDSGNPVEPRVLPVSSSRISADDFVDLSTSNEPKKTRQRTAGEPEHAETIAEFVLRGNHGMFERNIANRMFAALMGKGLVEPIDDQRLSNPAVHEPILDHLSRFARSGDVRKLAQHIVTSRLYRTSSEPVAGEPRAEAPVRFFARREARTMPSVTFRNAVGRALGTESQERLPKSPLARQLALLNSDFLRRAVDESQLLSDLIEFAPDAESRLEGLYALLLSRKPRPDEFEALLPALREDGSSGEGARDLAFALLASREFGSIR